MSTDPDPVQAAAAVEGYLFIESMLKETLHYVPSVPEHQSVWSPRFTTIILEACSQMDSLWKQVGVELGHWKKDGRPTIQQYFMRFGQQLAHQWVMFFEGALTSMISPFYRWESNTFKAPDYKGRTPEWWQAYNDLKHNRLANRKKATLENATQSLAALLLSIVYSGTCDQAIMDAELFDLHVMPSPFPKIRDLAPLNYARLESPLFAHPVGWCGKRKTLGEHWLGRCTSRFQSRWSMIYVEGDDPYSIPPVAR